ncbi:MAG: RusA family crossover junction endodeoxyribonuclease [Corynebacterium sp.]|nr:RusA family crossover junction endodeoxyribonuclease [Corynebacterium sp.]
MKIKFFVPGTPRPQGSKRHVGAGHYIEASRHLAGWRLSIIEATLAAVQPLHTPTWKKALHVSVEFVMPRPKRLRGKPTPPHISPPDLDKLQRAVGDALTQAEIIADDSQIISWLATKRRAADSEEPGAHMTIVFLDATVDGDDGSAGVCAHLC